MGSKALRLSEEEKTLVRKIRAARRQTPGPIARIVISTSAPSEAAPRTFATKAERAAGNGFACPQCARKDLRVAVKSGSFHEKDAKSDARDKVICTIA